MSKPIFDADEYQLKALRTAPMPEHALVKRFRELGDDKSADELHRLFHIFNHAMGLAGETGEIIDYLKKVLFHGTPFEKVKLTGELGDGRWYETNLANDFGIRESEVQGANVEKLLKRYPDGFTIESAQARVDEKKSCFFPNCLCGPGKEHGPLVCTGREYVGPGEKGEG